MSDEQVDRHEGDGGSVRDVEVHDLERKKHDRIPHRREADERDILPERKIANSFPIVAREGEGFIGPFDGASRKVATGRARWEGLIFPFTIHTHRRGAVEIRPSTKFYWADIEGHVKVETARIDGEGQIRVDLQETAMGFPRRRWTFRPIDLARYIEAKSLQSMTEVNDRAEALLEEIRNEGDGEGE